MEFLFDELQLLVEVGRCILVSLGQFYLIQYLIDSLTQLVQLVSIFLVLQLQGNDHLLVILLALPLFVYQILSSILTLLHQFYLYSLLYHSYSSHTHYIQKIFKSMSFPILQEYLTKFPECSTILHSLPGFYTKKLWNQLTIACLQLVYHPSAKGKITFNFYSQFIKRFQKNIDPTNLLKLIRETLVSLSPKQIIEFLNTFEKETANEDTKVLIAAFQGYFSIPTNLDTASQMITKVKTYIDSHKDVDSYIYSSYYRLTYTFYAAKRKYKQFYNFALQYLAYTQAEEIEEGQKLNLLFQMAVAVLVSEQIYNFSELMEQPLLISLKNSQHSWLYQLIDIFNRGDIHRFQQAKLQHEQLSKNSKILQQKIRLMAFLELAFNLPKSNRVVTFQTLSQTCGIPLGHVEFMVMKSMALKLVTGSIDQIKGEVTVGWVAPKVLETQRISTMLTKFGEWSDGVRRVQGLMKQVKV